MSDEMTMLDKYREFALNVSTGYDFDHYVERAKELLHEDFKEQVRDLWSWDLTNNYNSEEIREKLKSITNIKFVSMFEYIEAKAAFIEEHWDEIDDIITTLQDFIKEIEEEEKKEDPANE